MTEQHRIIEIDPKKFADRVPRDTDTGEHIFDEGDVLKFIIDALNAAKINISMVNHAHEMAIEYRGRRDYFSVGIASLDAPADAVIDGMAELSYILEDHEGIESWTAYKNETHTLHIKRKSGVRAAINEIMMTPDEVREAEDNIEADE